MAKKIAIWFVTGIAALSLTALTTLGACSKDDKKDENKGKAAPDKTLPTPDIKKMPKPPTAPGPEIVDEDLPIETDFEDEAEKSITAENFKAELDALEKEIDAEQ